MPIFPDTLQNLQNGTVQELNLQPYSMTREDLQTIIQCLPLNAHLKTLLFGSCQLDREILEAFANAIKSHPSLVELSLGSGNEIGDAGARAMAGALEMNQTLASLHMCKGNISDGGARAIARSLKQNKSLHILDLSDNKIGDEGATALADIFQHNKTLTRLKLDGNRIGYPGMTALSKTLAGNQTLVEFTITNNKSSEAHNASLEKAFEQSKNIITLKLDGNRVLPVCHENKQVVMRMFEKLKQNLANLPRDDVKEIKERIYSIAYVAELDMRVPRHQVFELMCGMQRQGIQVNPEAAVSS